MKLARGILLFSAFTLALFGETMHNSDVLRMVRNGSSVSSIIDKIRTSQPGYTLYPEDLKSLRQDGVPEVVIEAMKARNVGDIPAPPLDPEPVAAPLPPQQQQPQRGREFDRFSVGAFGGINGSERGGFAPKVTPSFGGEFGVMLHPNAELTGSFSRNSLGSYAFLTCSGICARTDIDATMDDAMVGFRAIATKSRRVQPFVSIGVGIERLTLSGNISIPLLVDGISGSAKETEFAVASGFGLKIPIARHVSSTFEFRGIRGTEFNWIFRATGGFSVTF